MIDGRVEAVRTSAIVTCPSSTYVQWINRVASRWSDHTLSITASWDRDYPTGWVGHGTATLRAHFDGDGGRGTLRTTQRMVGHGPPVICDSGAVSFSAD